MATRKERIDLVINFFIERLGYVDSQIKERVRSEFRVRGSVYGVALDAVISFHEVPKIIIRTTAIELKGESRLLEDSRYWKFVVSGIEMRADYFLIAAGTSVECYSLKGVTMEMVENYTENDLMARLARNGRIKNWEEVLLAENVLDDIVVAHRRCFDFLYERHLENPVLKFTLRKVNRANRLKKGYFFHGNENYCAISFWEGLDNYNKTPNIYVELENQNAFVLRLTCKDDDLKIPILERIAVLVGAYRAKSKGEYINTWHKYYYRNDYNADYIGFLEVFLKKDKEIIDLVLQAAGETAYDIQTISDVDFKKSLDRVLAIKKKLDQVKIGSGEEWIKDSYPVQLKTLNLGHIGSFKDLSLNLSARIICILGENGLGKTSILRAIALGMVGVDNSALIDKENKGLINLLQIIGVERGFPKRAKFGGITLGYELEELYYNSIILESTGPVEEDIVYLGDTSFVDTSSFGILQDDLYFNQLIIGFSQVRGKTQPPKKEGKSRLRPNLEDLLPLIYDQEDNRFDDLKLWLINTHSASMNKTENRPEELDKTGAYKVIIATIFDIISEVIGHRIKLVDSDPVYKRLWVQEEEKSPVLFELLSQGFRNVFGWIGHFIKRLAESTDYSEHFLAEHAIVLIDEIDAYLHPKWQRNILNVLVKKFPNTQFIVTTHSPLVASYVDDYEEMILYKIIRNGALIEANRLEKTYGLDNARILRSWMDLEDRTPVVGKKIDTLFELLEEEKLDEAKVLFNELKSYLGKGDEAISQASTEIELLEDDLEE